MHGAGSMLSASLNIPPAPPHISAFTPPDIDVNWMLFYSAASHSCQCLLWKVKQPSDSLSRRIQPNASQNWPHTNASARSFKPEQTPQNILYACGKIELNVYINLSLFVSRHQYGRFCVLQSKHIQYHQSEDGPTSIAPRQPQKTQEEEEYQQLQGGRLLWSCRRYFWSLSHSICSLLSLSDLVRSLLIISCSINSAMFLSTTVMDWFLNHL